MQLILPRDIYTENSTAGIMYVEEIDDACKVCFTLEPARRYPGIKVYGRTCMPAGNYQVDVTPSRRFKREMPIIYNQDNGFEIISHEGIKFRGNRMHGGNTYLDTNACILTGHRRLSDVKIYQSAESDVTELIKTAKRRGEQVWLRIIDQVGGA